MENKRLDTTVFLALFLVISVLMFFVFRPFIYIIVLAAVLAVLFQPVYKKFLHLYGEHKNFLAFLVVFIAFIFIIIPILFLGVQVFRQAQDFFILSQNGQGQYLQTLQTSIESIVRYVMPNFSFNIFDYVSKALSFISSSLGILISQTSYIVFQTFLLLFVFFLFLRDGESILASIISFSPFEKEQNKEVIDSVYYTINSVIRGTLFVGLIRWILLVIGFYLFHIPNAILWGSIAGIVGIVPGIGTFFAIVPAILYFLFTGNVLSAVGMILFGVLIVFFIDNMLSIYFWRKGLHVPVIFFLFSILGGILLFGPLGFIFGPIILSLFISTLEMYKILILKKP